MSHPPQLNPDIELIAEHDNQIIKTYFKKTSDSSTEDYTQYWWFLVPKVKLVQNFEDDSSDDDFYAFHQKRQKLEQQNNNDNESWIYSNCLVFVAQTKMFKIKIQTIIENQRAIQNSQPIKDAV